MQCSLDFAAPAFAWVPYVFESGYLTIRLGMRSLIGWCLSKRIKSPDGIAWEQQNDSVSAPAGWATHQMLLWSGSGPSIHVKSLNWNFSSNGILYCWHMLSVCTN